ncbi:MAG: outer membrane protein assembly factor BamD [Deltaproteobacteria bacterium]|nr:outer membrane protein assembly factor BamD [Deltaproteobacteria bacterium]
MKTSRRIATALAAVLLFAALPACGPKFDEMSPSQIYDYGESEFNDRSFSNAIEAYEALIDLYPFSTYVTQAELRIADSYFARKRWAEAAVAYEDFVERHPTNAAVPHCLHRLGLSHHKQKLAIDRDQAETHLAEQTLTRLVTQYPDYPDREDAEEKLREAREDLAARERYIARFYWREKEYYASLQRFERVVRDYSDTKFYAESLYYAGACLLRLDEGAEAKRRLDLLLAKFPDDRYADKARKLLDDTSDHAS